MWHFWGLYYFASKANVDYSKFQKTGHTIRTVYTNEIKRKCVLLLQVSDDYWVLVTTNLGNEITTN